MNSHPSSNNTETDLEIRRGGYAIVFIYAILILIVLAITQFFSIRNSYFFMGMAVVVIAIAYFIKPYIFNKPIITANKKGLYTRKLGFIPWNEIRALYIKREPKLYTKGLNTMDIYLCIETNDQREEQFDAMYLEQGEASATSLVTYADKAKTIKTDATI